MTESNIKELRIFDLDHVLVNELKELNTKHLSFPTIDLKSGMYIIELFDIHGNFAHKKLLIENE